MNRKWIALLIVVMAFGFIFYFNQGRWSEFEKIFDLSWIDICCISIMFVFSQVCFAFRIQYFMSAYGSKVSYLESFHVVNIQAAGNQLPMSAGLFSSFMYLKVKKQLEASQFVSYLAGDTLLKAGLYGSLGLLSSLVGWTFWSIETPGLIVLTMLGLTVLGVLALIIPESWILQLFQKMDVIKNLFKHWHRLRQDKPFVFVSLLVHLFVLLVSCIRLYLIFSALGQSVSFSAIVTIVILVNIIRMASLIPGNIGLRESIISGVASLYGYPFSTGLVAAMIDRALGTIVISLLGGASAFLTVSSSAASPSSTPDQKEKGPK